MCQWCDFRNICEYRALWWIVIARSDPEFIERERRSNLVS
jgi:hypothetical protein